MNHHHQRAYIKVGLWLLLLVLPAWIAARAEPPERRRDQFGTEFGYYIYPIGGDIPGLGSAQGLGATVLNIGDSDTDFTSFAIDGDFSARGGAFLDIHLIEKRLLLDVGAYDYKVAPLAYRRGMRTTKDDYLLPEAEGQYAIGQLTWTYTERRYEGYYRLFVGDNRLLSVRDSQGTIFSSVDTATHRALVHSIGFSLDRTDDRLDPRQGIRHELSVMIPNIDDPNRSDFFTTDYNFTAYKPFRKQDTLALNLFYSKAVVTNRASTRTGPMVVCALPIGIAALCPGQRQGLTPLNAAREPYPQLLWKPHHIVNRSIPFPSTLVIVQRSDSEAQKKANAHVGLFAWSELEPWY